MKFCVFTGIVAFINLCGGISLKKAGTFLDLQTVILSLVY